MCGGPSQAQKNALNSQSALSNELAGIARQRESFQQPYLRQRVSSGLPFLPQLLDYKGGTLARQLGPQRAQLINRLDASGNELPSGFKEQALTDFGAKSGRAFDDSVIQALMMDEETRARAAGLTNPLGYFSGAQQGYGSIMNMPQQQSPLGSIVGGAVSGLLGAFCWIAASVYGKSDFRVSIVRSYLIKRGGFSVWLYHKFGKSVAKLIDKHKSLRIGFKLIFDRILCNAGGL